MHTFIDGGGDGAESHNLPRAPSFVSFLCPLSEPSIEIEAAKSPNGDWGTYDGQP